MAAPTNRLSRKLIPDNCRFTSAREFSIQDCRRALLDNGIALISLGETADSDGAEMKKIVEQLGVAAIHDGHGTCIWDVRYDVNVDQETGTRSLTSKEFPLHTDGSFENPPPDFVALYCVQPDSNGGGETLFSDATMIRSCLSKEFLDVLRNHEFKLRVPAEFFKGQDTVATTLLDSDGNFRFRKDIIILDSCAPHIVQAVEELDRLINSPEHLQGIHLEKGQIVIFDNGRFFHGRRKINDKRRHLKRMWFHLKTEI